jgi:hypothetical protein
MRRISLTLGCLVIALACAASAAAGRAPTRDGVTGMASAVGPGPAGLVSKNKCKKKQLWRCAPKRYNLFVDGIVKWATGYESFFAEVHLVRRRAGRAYVLYKTEFGVVGLRAAYTAEFSDALLDCESEVTVDVPAQEIAVGPTGLFDPTDFLVRFDLIGPDKNTYGVLAGSTQPDPSTVQPAYAIVSCPADGRSVTVGGEEGFYFFGSDKLNTKHRGKLGTSVLVGGAINGGDTLEWVLTTHKHCGDFCDDLHLKAVGLSA